MSAGTGSTELSSTTTDPGARPSGPTSDRERSQAPDLARGCVLLFIALANVSTYFYGREVEAAFRLVGGSTLDDVLDFLVASVVDRRSYPMFAMLFGYGTWHMLRRQQSFGASLSAARRLVMRRNLWLVVFGLLHAGLLFGGDILGSYGAAGLVALLLIGRQRWVQLVVGGIGVTALAVLLGSADSSGGFVPDGNTGSYLSELVPRVVNWAIGVGVIGVSLALVGPFLIGAAVARAGLLDRPWEHLALLRRLAVGGITVGVVGGMPLGAIAAGWWDDPASGVRFVVGALHIVTGIAGGLGYLALFGWWAARRHGSGRPAGSGGVASAVAATGKRSLTCYLAQSVVLAPVMSGWGLAWGGRIDATTAYLLATSTWLATVILAVLMERAGSRGPAEVALRRLVYRRPVT
ncbi:MAG: DUF418 domain-containing protein [Phycicoccus sp.]